MQDRKRNVTREEGIRIIKWMFEKENSEFMKRNSIARVITKIFKDTEIEVSSHYINMNKGKWIMIDGEVYEKDKIPYEILKTDKRLEGKIFEMEHF